MPTEDSRQEQDSPCAAIIGTLADLALGRSEAVFDQLITKTWAALPPDLRADLVSYEIRNRARSGSLFTLLP